MRSHIHILLIVAMLTFMGLRMLFHPELWRERCLALLNHRFSFTHKMPRWRGMQLDYASSERFLRHTRLLGVLSLVLAVISLALLLGIWVGVLPPIPW